MKRMITIALLAVASLMTTLSANAQAMSKVTIPFDFTVGRQVLPAGTYFITQLSPEVIELDNSMHLIHFRVGVIPEDSVSERPNRMVFHQYGDRHFLIQLRGGVGAYVSKFYPSRLERNVRLEQSAEATRQIQEIAMK